MAPQTARWTAPDPPAKAPDAKFMAEPWALHPYAYVKQSPTVYWDADGEESTIIYAGYYRSARSLILRNDSWRDVMVNKVAGAIRAYWERRIASERSGDEESMETPVESRPMRAVTPSVAGGTVRALFDKAAGSDSIVLFGHVKVVRAKETNAVISSSIQLFSDQRHSKWYSPGEVARMLPKSIRVVYVLGCRSEWFAERLEREKPGVVAFGIGPSKKVFEGATNLRDPGTYEIFQYGEGTKKRQEWKHQEPIEFHRAEPSRSSEGL